ncbi:MAG: RNA polymerase subunit sigma-70 [Firmicutes bacterium]|nr:RNA polymerase subunit sigma-70 [Bacillota bacterium]
MTFSNRFRAGLLLDMYGPMLTAHQYEVWRLYYLEDWSLAEIGAAEHVSRAAVHDILERTERILEHYESRLQLLERAERRKARLLALVRMIDEAEEDTELLRRLRDSLGRMADEEGAGDV